MTKEGFRTRERKDGSKYHFPIKGCGEYHGKELEVNKVSAIRETVSTEEAKKIGEKLGLKWDDFDVDQFRRGMVVELEHGRRDSHTDVTGDCLLVTGKIALAHLKESPNYYDKLEEIEEEMKLDKAERETETEWEDLEE